MPIFQRTLDLPCSVEELFRWHARPGAFERLVPPWEDIRVVEKRGSIRDGDVLVMKVHKGPASVTWEAHHEEFMENRQFVDRQVRGPFHRWVHTHRFEPTETGSRLTDHVDYALPLEPLTALGRPLAEAEFDRMFRFRHLRTLQDIQRHARYAEAPMKIAITGASGFVGTALSAFLTTGGHTVVPLVRGNAGPNEIKWSVADDELDAASLEGFDAVIHLAGEPIAGRWTDAKKRRIMESRVKGTRLVAQTLAGMKRPPGVLISTSATGFYGDRGDEVLTEDSAVGEGFLPDVCRAWEESAEPAREAGIRVVHPRIGIVLSPLGGALEQMLTPFKLGAGGVVGSGDQYMSWITLDDVVGAILHLLRTDELHGPVNLTAPTPVTNREFTKVLGKVLHRPTIIPLPKFGVKLAFGEMGETLLFDSARVMPQRLLDTGFEFLHSDLEGGLRAELGR